MSSAANLGISINISAPIDEAERCCRDTGITRHSVEYSLGFCGRVDRLPDATTLELSTMCGHGMLSANFAKKMIDWVKENRRSPAEAARYDGALLQLRRIQHQAEPNHPDEAKNLTT